MQIVYAVLIAGALLGMTVFLTLMNKKTPIPEGCENLTPNCSACGITSCAIRQQTTEDKK